ncbi:MAG: PLP-dependent aminotransferase family protein [bacterium]|nr:PLP-dependent aminotransferase family protein [bacterium]
MSLPLQINREDSRPLYHQIASQIKNQISLGKLPPGTRLPSVRQVAQKLGVTRLTVHNAYAELQADGWIESTVGRGTFVSETAQPMALLSLIGTGHSAEIVLSNVYPISQIPTMRSLAYADPDASLAPIDDFWGCLAALRREAAPIMSYDSPQGDAVLRVELADLLRDRGLEAMPDEILVTQGAMQGLSLVTQALAQPGDRVLVENPTYLGMMHILKTYGMQPIAMPMDDDGPDLAALEQLLRRERPRFMYVIPTFHNPTGYVMSAQRRTDLLALAARYRLPIVEDDVYGLLSYDGPSPLPLKALDRDGIVIYLNTMSKVLMPGIRVGMMVPPPEFVHRLLSLKRAADMFSPTFIQRALASFLHQGRFRSHLRRVIPIYRSRRDALMQALAHYMPDGVTWTRPTGGFCTWVTLPQDNMTAIYQTALRRGLAFTPGQAFLTDNTSDRYFRLCFGSHPSDEIDEIVALLAGVIRDQHNQRTRQDDPLAVWTPLV